LDKLEGEFTQMKRDWHRGTREQEMERERHRVFYLEDDCQVERFLNNENKVTPFEKTKLFY
jgi:hypothetical protein